MNMKLLLYFLLLFLFSCRSIQYKKDYIDKRGERIFTDYNNNRTINISGKAAKLNAVIRNNQFLDTVSFRELKKRVKLYERFLLYILTPLMLKKLTFPRNQLRSTRFI
jgi:hypothetical protein